MIKGLPTEQFEIHLLIKSSGAHYLNEFKEKLSSFHSLNRQKFGRKALIDIIDRINIVKPDIIHSWSDTASFYSVIARMVTKNKYLLIDGSIRMAPPVVKKYNYQYLQRKVINQFSDVIVANSKAGLKSYLVPEAKSRCINNGFDINRIKQFKDPDRLKKELGIKTRYIIILIPLIKIKLLENFENSFSLKRIRYK